MTEQERALGAPAAGSASTRVKLLEIALRWLLDEIKHEHCGSCDEYFMEQNGHVVEECGPLHYAVKQAMGALGDEPKANAAPAAPKEEP